MTLSDPLLDRLSASDEAASLALLTHLCRQCPALRRWLWNDFARGPQIRKEFARVVDDAAQSPPARLIDLSDDGGPWREELRRLREELPTRPFGGLSLREVEILIRRYQAGSIDLGTFLLVRDWQKPGSASPALIWAGVQFLDALLPSHDWRLHSQLANAFTFLRRFGEKTKRRASFSPSDWWKAQVLFYILRNPCPAYRTRDLRAHVASLGVRVSTKDMRRFCGRHGIRRDVRAGRPPKTERSRLAPALQTDEQRGRAPRDQAGRAVRRSPSSMKQPQIRPNQQSRPAKARGQGGGARAHDLAAEP